MSTKPQPLLFLVSLLLSFGALFHSSRADLGTASQYGPPYTPTACFGSGNDQFPASNLFAAAGEAVWDNGAACGRQYLVRCGSAAVGGTCIDLTKTIQVIIVDREATSVARPSRPGATLALSNTAYAALANPGPSSINIDFQQV